MKKMQQGFTLIELMIVIAIIGILAAIAIPAYNDYIARAQASEGVELLAGGKTPMAEFYADNGRWPNAADSVMGTLAGKYVASVAITGGNATSGTLTMTATFATLNVNKNIAGGTITLTTDDAKTWYCNGGSIAAKYRPSSCR